MRSLPVFSLHPIYRQKPKNRPILNSGDFSQYSSLHLFSVDYNVSFRYLLQNACLFDLTQNPNRLTKLFRGMLSGFSSFLHQDLGF